MYTRVVFSRKVFGILLFFSLISYSNPLPDNIVSFLVNADNSSRGVVIKKFSRIRSGPDINSNFLFLARQNDTLQILGEKNGWYRIKKDNVIGWAGKESVNPLTEEKNPTGRNSLTIVKNYARIRKVPDNRAPFLFLAKKGKEYRVLGQNDDWFLIEFENNRKGWIESGYTDRKPEKNSASNSTKPVRRQIDSVQENKAEKIEIDTVKPRADSNRISKKEEKKTVSSKGTAVNRKWMPKIRVKSSPIKKVIRRITHNEPGDNRTVQIISSKPVPLRKELSPDSPVIDVVRRGTILKLIQSGETWSKIIYKNDTGWVEKRFLKVTDSPSTPVLEEFSLLIMIILALTAVIILIWFFLSRTNKTHGRKFKSDIPVEKKVVIFSLKEKIVSRYLTDNRSTLKNCFTEIGFSVTYCRTYRNLINLISHTIPDAILIDWQADKDIQKKAAKILSSKTSTSNIFTIFYNVPDPDRVEKVKNIPNSQLLGINFTDRDIFSLLTPLILTGDTKKQITKSVEESALEGMIEEGNLSEVFQFIEIGSKTGCLIINTDGIQSGIIYFNSGIIKYAATKNRTGRDAVLEILYMKKGKYNFVLNRTTEKENCSIPALGILMEWAKEKDESNVH